MLNIDWPCDTFKPIEIQYPNQVFNNAQYRLACETDINTVSKPGY